jgi:DNA invertase Pin-like site-specific DNA recombinase
MRVLAYLRVSTSEQADSRAGLEAQRAAIAAEAERRGWEVVETFEDAGYSAKDMKRPAIQAALAELKRGRGDALVVAKLDRLSRSLLDFAGLMAMAQRQSWGLVALDCNVDTSTPAGEAMASILATFAQFERRLIGQRTREALAERRKAGVKLGRSRLVSPEVEKRVHALRRKGMSYRHIAAALASEGYTPPSGGEWQPSTLQRILARPVAA